jgi:hypothetical protein
VLSWQHWLDDVHAPLSATQAQYDASAQTPYDSPWTPAQHPLVHSLSLEQFAWQRSSCEMHVAPSTPMPVPD